MKKILIIIVSLFVFSCSSNHEIYINKDNSANVKFSVTNKDSLIETLKGWGAINNNSNELIDTVELTNTLNSDPNIKNFMIISNKNNNYTGNFLVKNINNMFSSSKENIPQELQIFNMTEANGLKKLEIKLSIDNYKYLKKTIPVLQQESIDMLGPDANQDISEEEYLDMISFPLGDNGPKDIKSSFINLDIVVDGTITSLKGGKKINNNSVNFNIPLIDIILLQKTLVYSVTYK